MNITVEKGENGVWLGFLLISECKLRFVGGFVEILERKKRGTDLLSCNPPRVAVGLAFPVDLLRRGRGLE